jgi:hypothetical protein
MSRSVLARVALGVAAVAVAAWFALGAIQSHDIDAAGSIINSQNHLTAIQADRASSLLDGAATLNPDLGVQLLRSQLAAERGDRAEAHRLALEATRKEPLNADAWVQLIHVSTGVKVLDSELGHLAALRPIIRSKR